MSYKNKLSKSWQTVMLRLTSDIPCIKLTHSSEYLIGYTVNCRLSGVMEGRKVIDNQKAWLKQKQSKHGTKWI
jgi:hypothetical protein